MAKNKSLSKLIASLEDQDGTVQVVDANNPSADLKNEVETPKTDAVQTGEAQKTDDAIQADMNDFTAIDKASIAQGEAIHKQMERLADAGASVEAYIGILRSCLANGQSVDKGTAMVMRQDLMAQYPKAFNKLCVALEEAEEQGAIGYSSSSKELATTSAAAKEGDGALAKIKAAMIKAYEKFMAWLKQSGEKLRALVKKIKDWVKGMRTQTKELDQVIKALPNPGQPFKALPSGTTSDLGSVKALEAAVAAKETVPEPPEKVSVDYVHFITKDGKVDLNDNQYIFALVDFQLGWVRAVPAALAQMRKHIEGLIANPPEKTFNNEEDEAAVNQIMADTVGKVAIPEDQGWGFGVVKDDEGSGWSMKPTPSERNSVDMDLMSKQDTEKANNSIADVMDKMDDLTDDTVKANEAYTEYSEWLSSKLDGAKSSLARFIRFPADLRAGTSYLPNQIQIALQQRIGVIDAHVKARIKGKGKATE